MDSFSFSGGFYRAFGPSDELVAVEPLPPNPNDMFVWDDTKVWNDQEDWREVR